jgi:benzoate-CoA ligase family protein
MTTINAPAPPTVDIPRELNVAVAYVDRPAADYGERTAYVYEGAQVSYAGLRELVNRTGNAIAALGVEMEQRVALLLPNRPEFVTAFFGAIKIGAVAAPISTAVTPDEQIFLLNDSRARAIVATEALWAPLRARRSELPFLRHVLLVGGGAQAGEHDFGARVAAASADLSAAPTTCDDVAIWLHTSGSTGTPKWAMHLHRNLLYCEQLYAAPIIGLTAGDVIVSGSPCFHAYPLGFTTYFALRRGATVVLNPERPTPARMFHLLKEHGATVLIGVPTLYAQMLQAAEADPTIALPNLRLCVAAAEPLPAEIERRWRTRFGVEILDGIGTTEALHVFISNRQGEVRPGSSGRPVPGYDIRLVDEHGVDVPPGETGNLMVRGGSLFAGYWSRHDVTRRVLQGEWYQTGDRYYVDDDGYYWYRGRADDMLRVSGHWVSPTEVEAALIAHPAVLEAAVVGRPDADELIKPQAFVVLREGFTPSEALAEELKAHIKATMAPYNYPRWVEFRSELPKTATGKIQRFKLRG